MTVSLSPNSLPGGERDDVSLREFHAKEALSKRIPFMPFAKLRRAFDKALLSEAEGLTTNGIKRLPFTLPKDLFRDSLAI